MHIFADNYGLKMLRVFISSKDICESSHLRVCQNGLHILRCQEGSQKVKQMFMVRHHVHGFFRLDNRFDDLPGKPPMTDPWLTFLISDQCRSEHRTKTQSNPTDVRRMAPRQASNSSCCMSCMAARRRFFHAELFESFECSKATPWTPFSDWLMVSNNFYLHLSIYIYMLSLYIMKW